jgi:hypothetical protein
MVEDVDWDGDTDEDTDETTDGDMVREAVMAVVREGEAEAIALIEGVEASVAERERLWLWLNVEDVDPDTVAIEDMVMDLLGDMETLSDEEGVLLGDVEGDTDWTGDDVGVPEAGSVATSNPIDAGGIHNSSGAVGSAHGRVYTPS